MFVLYICKIAVQKYEKTQYYPNGILFFLLNKKKIVGVSPSDNADCLCRNRVYVSSEIDFRPFGFYK